MPATRDLAIYRGDDWSHTVTVKSNGTPVDLGGWSAWRCQVRRTNGDTGTPVASPTVDTTDAATGTVVLRLAHALSANLPTGTFVYDLEGTDAGGQVTTLMSGRVQVEADVTH